jgi:alpha-beta hydrolase superfamily lysophospholipase
MKKWLLRLGGILLVLAAVAGLGPRPKADPTLRTVALPEDLDAYLREAEAQVPNLRPGTGKTIVWADTTRRRTLLALVYLHGFSATRAETAPLCDSLARRLGANLYYARLTGHGQGADDLAEASANDWLNDGAEALAIGQRLGERVVLVGTSTGATLALWLAAQPQFRETLAALVLVSPNFRPKDPMAGLLYWPWSNVLVRAFAGPYRSFEPLNAEQEHFWTTRYRSDALLDMTALLMLVDQTDLGQITAPTLVFYAPADQVVSGPETARRFPQIGATRKQLVEVPDAADPSDHVLAGAILSPNTTARLIDQTAAFVTGQ